VHLDIVNIRLATRADIYRMEAHALVLLNVAYNHSVSRQHLYNSISAKMLLSRPQALVSIQSVWHKQDKLVMGRVTGSQNAKVFVQNPHA